MSNNILASAFGGQRSIQLSYGCPMALIRWLTLASNRGRAGAKKRLAAVSTLCQLFIEQFTAKNPAEFNTHTEKNNNQRRGVKLRVFVYQLLNWFDHIARSLRVK